MTIVVHGGAWDIPKTLVKPSIKGVEAAVKVGWELLTNGNSSVDAVEAAVMTLENDPTFDAGIGSVLTEDGSIEMDAMIMDGSVLEAGAVAGVQNVKNPVHLARLVMEQSDHVMLVGEGAMKFAREMHVSLATRDELLTKAALASWNEYRQFKKAVNELFSGHDTVGAVAIDYEGHVAAATSTGGITGKKSGRVGDTPLIGAGGYADDLVGAASATGHGEAIIKVGLSRQALFLMQEGMSPMQASTKALKYMKERVKGFGGLIVVDIHGRWTAQFTTKKMAWAAISNGELFSGCERPSE